jgi:hypothetical protein
MVNMKQLSKEDLSLIATLQFHAGFNRLMEWSEEQEKEQAKLLLTVDAFKDPEQVTKLQACLLEKDNYRKLLKTCIENAAVDTQRAEKMNEEEKQGLLKRLRARI